MIDLGVVRKARAEPQEDLKVFFPFDVYGEFLRRIPYRVKVHMTIYFEKADHL